mgnify:CR=1 FL=1
MKIVTSFVIALLLSTILFTPKSHALVGWIVKSPTTRSVGGVVIAGGLAFSFIGARTASDGWVALGNMIGGWMVAGLGLVILNEQQIAEAEFTALNTTTKNYNDEELATYNSELAQLNAVHQTVVAQVRADANLDEVQLWREYGALLSPATLKIAAFNGQRLLNTIR